MIDHMTTAANQCPSYERPESPPIWLLKSRIDWANLAWINSLGTDYVESVFEFWNNCKIEEISVKISTNRKRKLNCASHVSTGANDRSILLFQYRSLGRWGYRIIYACRPCGSGDATWVCMMEAIPARTPAVQACVTRLAATGLGDWNFRLLDARVDHTSACFRGWLPRAAVSLCFVVIYSHK